MADGTDVDKAKPEGQDFPERGAGATATSARYTLWGDLDPAAHRVRGRAVIELRNHAAPLRELWLQLYANATRDAHSVYQQGRAPAPGRRGKIVLLSLQVNGREQLASARTELLPGDHTQLRLPLAEPVPPDGVVLLDIRFETQLPQLGERSGYYRDFHLITQWYPKLARRDADGDWLAHPFDRMAEFRADYASYDVHLRAPAGWLIEAPGMPRANQSVGEQRFTLEPATDIAWAACLSCTARRELLGDIELRSLVADGASRAAARQLNVVRKGLSYFGQKLGPYPYAGLSVVVPPRSSPALGMEYPALIVVPPGPSLFESVTWLDGRHVAAHELAHQWFYAVVQSDEVRWPVLDESLSEWAAQDLLRSLWPRRHALGFASSLDSFDAIHSWAVASRPPPPPAGSPAYQYDRRSYGRAVYARAALALESVRRSHGDPRFRLALRAYVRAQRFRHADIGSLAQAFDQSYGAGFFKRQVAPLWLGGGSGSVQLTHAETRPSRDGFLTHVTAHRSGEVSQPTWLSLLGPKGREQARVAWPAHLAALDVRWASRRAVHRVTLDPDHALLLDRDRTDNTRELRQTNGMNWIGLLFTYAHAAWSLWGP